MTDRTSYPSPGSNENELPPEAYHRVVGPPLKAAAETAARRGNKTLFEDMPAMLSLVDMVTRLADLYRQHDPDLDDEKAQLLEGAAMSACVMVFQNSELPEEAINDCLGALQAAYRQLNEQAVIDLATPHIAMAWSHMEDEQREQAQKCLTEACEKTIAAIEVWEANREQ